MSDLDLPSLLEPGARQMLDNIGKMRGVTGPNIELFSIAISLKRIADLVCRDDERIRNE